MIVESKGTNVGDCCSEPARVLVEFDYLTVEGETCDRCGDTRDAVRAAVADARAALPASLAILELVERELPTERLAESNRVLVNGRLAEEWLGGTSLMSDCPSCSGLVGESVCCREIEVGGVQTEAVGRDVVFDAIMAAAGLGGAAEPMGSDDASAVRSVREDSEEGSLRAVASCCAPAVATVTLVTGPGCGWGGDLLCDPGSEVDFTGPEGSAWDMPSAWRVHVITAALKAAGFRLPVSECDVYSLPAVERTTVVDALIAERTSFPMVLVHGRVACHAGVDLDAIIRAVREGATGGCGCC